MAEDYKYQVSISLPPSGQFAKGDMLNVRADHADELGNALDKLFGAGAADRILARFNVATMVELDFTKSNTPAATVAASGPAADASTGGGACPECDLGILTERKRKDGKGTFVGCGRFPECRYIQKS